MTVIRSARPEDDAALAQLDASIETDAIYEPVAARGGFELKLKHVAPPFRKEYSLARFREMAPACDHEWVAESGGRLVGFIGTAFEDWHKRCAIWHFYVDKAHRRQGIGRRLMNAAETQARASGAELLWVETQNVNVPAIAAYRALGFALCGLDTTLYRGTPEAGESAIFLARRLGPAGTRRFSGRRRLY